VKLLYRPLSLLVSVVGGIVAGALFKKIWQGVAGEDEAPKPGQADRGWKEVATAAVLQGAVTGGVSALVDRGSLRGFEKVTGVWAGESSSDGN
jgi:Protein of unknown function (DUF4235)